VLTGARDFEEVYRTIRAIDADTIKVVTGWGLSWDNYDEGDRRSLVCSLVPNTVVRTRTGDPSSGGTLHPIPENVVREIQPWYDRKRNIIIEISNEPNVYSSDINYIYEFRWYLAECIHLCRTRFPHAKIMSTAVQPDKDVERWHQIFSEPNMNIYDMVDYVGVHAYEHMSFAQPITHHYDKMLSIFSKQKSKLFFSELGINGKNSNKLAEYRKIAKQFPVTYYHYNSALDIDPQYHVEVL
jgi:hypothetical protein